MYDLIIIRYGEMGLKGKNFSKFSQALKDDIRRRLAGLLEFKITSTYGRIFLDLNQPIAELPPEVVRTLQLLPGIASFSPAVTLKPSAEIDKLADIGSKLIESELNEGSLSFKVETNRANKDYPFSSPEVSKKTGGMIYQKINNLLEDKKQKLTVDVHSPDIQVEYDIRDSGIYVFYKRFSGSGGLPLGSAESALLLLSAGIDSPVAGWQMMRRGAQIKALHFHTPPYTGEKALEKVRDLSQKLARYNGSTELYICEITDIQRQIREHCHKDYSITILRRMMLRIATELAKKINAQALVTGDSLGQVASQTITNLRTISSVARLPILRPLLTWDKHDIIGMAKKIGTYEISIRPHQDCCSIFVPENPITKPRPRPTEKTEKALPIEELVQTALDEIEKEIITAK